MFKKIIVALFLLFTVNAYTVSNVNRVEFGNNYEMYLGSTVSLNNYGYAYPIYIDYCTYNQSKKLVECKFKEDAYKNKYYLSIPILSNTSEYYFKKGELIYGFTMYHEQCTGCKQTYSLMIANTSVNSQVGTEKTIYYGKQSEKFKNRFEFRMGSKNGRIVRLIYDKVNVKSY